VLVDTSRLEDCVSAVDYFESNGVPFIVAVNAFHGQLHHSLDEVRDALAVPHDVPLIRTDARDRSQTKLALLELVQHALLRASS
jgi:signal recognition particle receptor subunit beta